MHRRDFLSKAHVRNLASGYAKQMKQRWQGTYQLLSGDIPEPAPVVDQAAIAERLRHKPLVPFVRPPGAVAEADFLAGCTRCGECAAACPYDAIREAPPGFREAAGTPIIIAIQNPCQMCPDTPCIPVCEPGVLRLEPPYHIATAKIRGIACISSVEEPCTVCSEACPIEGVIVLVEGRPQVDVDGCTGCGICQSVCPAPRNAIIIEPRADRPPMPVAEAD